MTDNNMPDEAVPASRRNGQRPSCEPCRKSKYRCDHTMPKCMRCQRRGIANSCIYHPAPMRGLSARVQRNFTKRNAENENLSNQISTSQQTKVYSKSDSTPTFKSARRDSDFLGLTSYAAVYTEYQDQIEIDADAPASEPECTIRRFDSSHDAEQKVRQGAELLALLTDMQHFEPMIEKYIEYDSEMGFLATMLRKCVGTLKKDIQDAGMVQSKDSLLATSEMLFRNTAKPIQIPKNCKFNEYQSLVTGSFLRWEILGEVFTALGFCANDLRYDDRLFDFIGHRSEDRTEFMYKCLDASSVCLGFCESSGQLSDLGLWLLLENCVLMSQVLGDSDYMVWRRVGDLSTALFAQGLHQDPQVSPEVPFWLAEVRRRFTAQAYGIDKVLCTFVGRPPRISQRYCSISLPLDIEFDELALEGPELERALSQLGPDGWNSGTNFRKCSLIRTAVMVAKVREEILELSLGPIQDQMPEKVQALLNRNQQMIDSLPERMRYKEDLWDHAVVEDAVARTSQYLEMMYNEFMLRRTMARRLMMQTDDLLRVARNILTVVLRAANSPRSSQFSAGCPSWFAGFFGLPAAGVLAMALLEQTRSSATYSVKAFPRSKVIQELSVFTSCLGYMLNPGEGNHRLMQQARKMILLILDKVLSSETPTFTDTNQNYNSNNSSLPSITYNESSADSSSLSQDQMYDFSWVETELDTDFWMNLPEHPLLLT